MTQALIFDALRTPRGKGKPSGALHSVKPVSLVAGLLTALQRRTDLDTSQVDDVVLGCVTPIGDQGSDIAKTAVQVADWDVSVAGVQINRFCASGLEAVNLGAMKVRSGFEDLVVVGGVESMSRVPMGSDGGAWALDPQTNLHGHFIPQGVSADLIATLEGFSRQDVDAYALHSQQKAARARADGAFKNSLVPVQDQNGIILLDHDEFIRAESTLEGLGKLKPSFEMIGQMGFDATALRVFSQVERIDHVHTPGNTIRYEKGQDQIVVLTIDLPGQSANTMNALYREAMADCVARLQAEKDSIAGVIITSAKKTFFAGGDLNELIKVDRPQATSFYNRVLSLKSQLRTLETLGKPMVAAINGAALGGGWEICLACHHRIALDDPSLQLGLPEVTLGLLPGGGGVVRMVRMLGIEKALPYLLEGKKLAPQKALQAGLIDDLASDREALLSKARTWIKANPTAVQRWDVKGYQIPGGTPSNPKVAQMLAIAPSILRSKTQGTLPAPEKILCAAVEGAQVDFDTAQLIETRYFTELVTGQVAKNLIGTFWFQLNQINAGGSRPEGFAPYVTKKVGVLGAGMMGAGIAFVSASAGVDVVLKDVNLAAAEKGKAHSAALLDKKVARRQISVEQ
eukprot:gene6487-6343_t